MITLKNICVTYGKTPVLNNLSATIQEGDFITIIGANGAGKSTFFDVIAGNTKPLSGQLIVDDTDITNLDEKKRAAFIARLCQNPWVNVVPSMTVAENLALATFKGKSLSFKSAIKQLPLATIERVLKPMNENIHQLLDKQMKSLSGGQRQMIALVMATLTPPKILLLDEPTAALDPQSATKLLVFAAKYIKEHKITTLLITHDPHIATQMGNKLWVLEDGVIKKEFGPEKRMLSTEHLIGEIDYAALI